MSYSSVFTDYLGQGDSAEIPGTLNIAPTALGLFYDNTNEVLHIWNTSSGSFDTPLGSITSIVAGHGLDVGAGPGGTITSGGTLNFHPITAGLISSNGTIPEATTIVGGASWSAGVLTAAAAPAAGLVSSNGTTLETTSLSGLSWSADALALLAATTASLGGVIVGSGVTVNAGGTISTGGAGVPSAGLVSSNGTALVDTTIVGASWSSETLTVTGVSNAFLLAIAGRGARLGIGGFGT